MISQDHVTKASRDMMGRRPSRYITTMPSLVAIGTGKIEIYTLLYKQRFFSTQPGCCLTSS